MAHLAARVAQRIEQAREEEGASLDLSDCELIAIPQAVGFVLKEVPILKCDLSLNLLKSISPKLNALASLRELIVRNNVLTSIAPQLVLANLEILDVSFNKLTVLPEAVFTSFPSLQRLIATDNQIAEPLEPAKFAQLPDLQVLNLDNNPIANSPSLGVILSQFAYPSAHRRY